MKKLDLYIIKNFLSTFFYILALIMAIAVVFDVSEKIDDFLKSDPPFWDIVFDYYLNFVIYYSNLFSALLIFIAVILFTAKMAANTEIVAILSSGVSFTRLLLPYFIAATVLTSLSFSFNHWVIPIANKNRLAFEDEYIRNAFRFSDRNIHRQINENESIYFERYNNEMNIAYQFTWEKWEEEKLVFKLMADYIALDTITMQWRINNYFIREIDGLHEKLRSGRKMDTTLYIPYEDFSRRITNVETMVQGELDVFIDEEQKKGSDEIPYYMIEKYQRTSYPFATYILTLIGVSIASRKIRGGIGMHIAVGMLICVTYILAMKVTTVYATNAGLQPAIAVWIPNVLFGIFALYLLKRAMK